MRRGRILAELHSCSPRTQGNRLSAGERHRRRFMKTANATRKPRPQWAVLSYMVSDALQLPAAHADIVEMQRVGSSEDVKIAIQVQLKAGDEFKRFTVEPRKPSILG